jgi:hypothetical protein
LFDELARPSPHLGLDRVKPVVEKINRQLGTAANQASW